MQHKDRLRFQVIVNPLAGRGFGARSVPRICRNLERLLLERGHDFDLVITTRAREAVELARRAVLDGYDTIVAVGGDGTYQEVINGMMAAAGASKAADASKARRSMRATNGASQAPATVVSNLGVIPVGSGCDFAWAVGIPSDLEEACARLAQHRTKVVDLGRVTVDADTVQPGVSRYFDNTVGIGFDGIVTEECRKFKYLRGMALYLPVVLKTVFMSFQPIRAVIEYDATYNGSPLHEATTDSPDAHHMHRLVKTVLMATVCNGQREGGGFFIAPNAENDDGLLDLCLADNIPRLQILGMIPHFIKGTHVDKPTVTMIRSRRVVITSQDPLIAHADGEILCTDAHRIECEILPRQIRVVC